MCLFPRWGRRCRLRAESRMHQAYAAIRAASGRSCQQRGDLAGSHPLIVPTLQRGNAFLDAPASRGYVPGCFLDRSVQVDWVGERAQSGINAGRWSVRGCVPTLERGNDHNEYQIRRADARSAIRQLMSAATQAEPLRVPPYADFRSTSHFSSMAARAWADTGFAR